MRIKNYEFKAHVDDLREYEKRLLTLDPEFRGTAEYEAVVECNIRDFKKTKTIIRQYLWDQLNGRI